MAPLSATRSLALCCLFATALSLGSSFSKVVLRDNGYEGVVIAIEDRVPSSKCQEIIQGLEDVVRAASSTIFVATRGRANFRSVRVLVPSSWNVALCPSLGDLQSTRGETWDGADLRVTQGRHPRHGPRPWTLHTKGCGQTGDYISLGHDLLLSNDTIINGRLLAHEWLQYRYGVFEETGWVENPVHPAYYRASDGQWRPNACANVELSPNPSCHPHNASCPFRIEQGDSPQLTKSFMAFPELPSVKELCDEGSHNREAPTRHNLLCDGKSAWEVMRASPDFQNNRNVEGGLRESEVTFQYVRPRNPRIVLLIDDTNVMNVQKRWDFMRKAVRKLVTYDVPDGYGIGLVVFNSIPSTKYPMTILTDGITREKVGSSLPRNPSREDEHKRCIICGVREALKLIQQDGIGGHIVMVTAGSGLVEESEASETAQLLLEAHVVLHAIIYPLAEKYPTPNGGLETLAARSGGNTFVVRDEGIGADSKLSMYYNLLDSFYHALLSASGQSALPVKVHSAEHPGGRVPISEGSFMMDPTLGTDTVFAIFYYDVTHVGNQVHLVSPHGQVIDTANMQNEDGNINMITVRLVEAQVTPGLWRYKVENRADSHQALYVQVTSRPRLQPRVPSVKVRTWINPSLGVVNASDISKPLALYAEVRVGLMGVEGAKVIAMLTRLGYTNNGTQYPPLEVQLFDNGLTSPDMTKGDGVYSRFVPGLVSGKYSIIVNVEGKIDDSDFARRSRLGIVDVIGTLPKRDVLPPAHVVDLRAALLPDTVNQVAFTWTAPGGDIDYGTADRYVVMASNNQLDLLEGGGTLLEDWPAPLASPAIQQHTVLWKEYETVSYVSLYAVDEEGNTGGFSNIVSVYVPAPPTTTVAPPSKAPPLLSANTSAVKEGTSAPVLAALDTHQLAVIFGCVGGFIVVVAVIVCYCAASHRHHRKAAAAKKAHEVPDAYSINVTVASKGVDFAEGKEKDGIKKEYISPVESWSASQLLSNHQDGKRSSMSGRSDNNSDHSASTKKSYGGSSEPNDFYGEANQYHYQHAGYPDHYPAQSDGYPTPTEGFPNDNYPPPSEARSYMSSQPSDSFLSVSCDLLPSTHGPPAYAAYPSYDSSLRSGKVPPPIPPKPKVLYTPEPYMYDTQSLDPHSSTPSVASEKRVRNVTMV
ncbi:calcium-activated chloride channel regulator 1-like [Macrobrachium rosenbergii]|uniref:calcium-activated chloride channel regulator 1-like n=1 Tax=Macrobrachium rosenbergii TaxID=79674 RepID=UPI0034D77B12